MKMLCQLVALSLFLSTQALSSTSQKPDEVLVVASTRLAGYLSEVALYNIPKEDKNFTHENLGRKVTSIDTLPLFNGSLGGLEGRFLDILPHVMADARHYKGFRRHQFDLIFMELPPSCQLNNVLPDKRFEKAHAEYKHTCLIPQMLRNLADTLTPNGLLEIEHLPLTCLLSAHQASQESDVLPGQTFIEELIQKDPFTIYQTDLLIFFLSELSSYDRDSLKRVLASRSLFNDQRSLSCRFWSVHLPHIKRAEQAATAELRYLDYFHDALHFRAKKEKVFPEVLINLMAYELKNRTYNQPDSYTRMILTYAHLFSVRASIQPIKDILEPLGFEDIGVKVKKESYNGRINAWFIMARKKA